MKEKGMDEPFEQVLEEVVRRDEQDMNREVEPLRRAEDAVLVDTTHCDLEESYQLLLKTIRERM
jgi:cytidylate kinase